MKDYFKLQWLLTNRKFKESGYPPVFGYLLLLGAFGLFSVLIFEKTSYAPYLISLICLSLMLPLAEKNKLDFLVSIYGDKTKMKIRILENLLICLPFVTLLLLKSFFIAGLLLFLSSLVLALFNFQFNNNFTIPTPFAKRPFEFPIGVRKTYPLLLLAYVFAVVAILYDNLNLGIFSFLFIFLVILSFYSIPEPDFLVWIHAESPKIFLKNKVWSALKNATFLILPVIIGLMIYYPSEWISILFFYLIGLLVLPTFLFAKYAAYPNEINLPEVFILLICLFVPPLLLLGLLFFYKKAIKQLQFILNDSN